MSTAIAVVVALRARIIVLSARADPDEMVRPSTPAPDPAHPRHLITEPNRGYRFHPHGHAVPVRS